MATRKASYPELGPRLRSLRVRAGLTQEQVAIAIGLQCRGNANEISRLELGKIANPSLGLVLDFLRACGAKTEDIAPLLERELGRPLPVPACTDRAAHGPRPIPEDPESLAARQEAARWLLRQRVELALHEELNRLAVRPGTLERRLLARLGRQLFQALAASRGRTAQVAHRRLTRIATRSGRRGIGSAPIAALRESTARLFDSLAASGELERLPLADEAERILARSPRRRLVTDELLCRKETRERAAREFAEFEARRRPILVTADQMLAAAGVTGGQLGHYLGIITGLVNACRFNAAGTQGRSRAVEHVLAAARPGATRPELLAALAALIQQQWDAPAVPADA